MYEHGRKLMLFSGSRQSRYPQNNSLVHKLTAEDHTNHSQPHS